MDGYLPSWDSSWDLCPIYNTILVRDLIVYVNDEVGHRIFRDNQFLFFN